MLVNDVTEDNIGQEFYVFYLDRTKNTTRVYNYLGVVKIKLIEFEEFLGQQRPNFVILESSYKLTDTKIGLLEGKLNRYNWGMYLYNTYEEAVKAHDETLIGYAALAPNPNNRKNFYKYLLGNEQPSNILNVETNEAIEWFNNLPEKEQDHVRWLYKNFNFK
jgi:hypothetical protein